MNRIEGKWNACKLAVLAAIGGFALSGPASAQGSEFPILGGKGGGFFKVFCPPHNFLVGLEGRAGDVIDNLELRCRGFRTIESIPPRKNWRVDPLVFPVGPRIGESMGGAPLTRLCTNHNFVRGIEFNTEFFDGIHLIAFITMTCDHGTLAGFDELKYGFNFPFGTGPQKQFCPDGMWAIGLQGRRGGRVDAIGLLCAPMP